MDKVDEVKRKLTKNTIIKSMAILIEAEALVLVSQKHTDNISFFDTIYDSQIMSDIILEAMVTMIPNGHKYESLRQEATIEVTKSLNERADKIRPAMKILKELKDRLND